MKYKSISIEMRATLCYTVCNILQKVAPWIILMILTKYLVVNDYGKYAVIMSWIEIMDVVTTLKIYQNSYIAGLVKYEDRQYDYTASIQNLSFLLVTSWFILSCFFYESIYTYTNIDMDIWLLIIFSFYNIISYGIWTARQRLNNNYKGILLSTLFYGVLAPILGAFSVFYKTVYDPILLILVVRIIGQTFISIKFLLANYFSANCFFNLHFIKKALWSNLVLAPYYLSMMLLNHSDRLIIQHFCGFQVVGLFSVAFSISMIAFVVVGALNLSLQVWLYKALKINVIEKQYQLMDKGALLVICCCSLLLILAPELITFVATSNYKVASYIVPPIVISVFVMYIYQQYVNVLFYFSKSFSIMFGSVCVALINIFLDLWLVPIYGYIISSYTTLLSYVILMYFYYVVVKKVFKDENIPMTRFFNTNLHMRLLSGLIFIGIIMIVTYEWFEFRVCLILLLTLLSLFYKSQIRVTLKYLLEGRQ